MFEHGFAGTRALVVNRPTPLRLKDLDLPFTQREFDANVLFHGGDPSGLSGPPPPTPRATVAGGHNLLSRVGAGARDGRRLRRTCR